MKKGAAVEYKFKGQWHTGTITTTGRSDGRFGVKDTKTGAARLASTASVREPAPVKKEKPVKAPKAAKPVKAEIKLPAPVKKLVENKSINPAGLGYAIGLNTRSGMTNKLKERERFTPAQKQAIGEQMDVLIEQATAVKTAVISDETW